LLAARSAAQRGQADRMMDLLMDGLRRPAPAGKPPPG